MITMPKNTRKNIATYIHVSVIRIKREEIITKSVNFSTRRILAQVVNYMHSP